MKGFGGQLAALAALAFVSACNCAVVANPEGARCDVGNVCSKGYVCIDGRCRGISGQGGGTAQGGGQGGGPAGGTGGAAGQGGGSPLCDGVVCNMPPLAMCVGDVLTTYAGACDPSNGICLYSPMPTPCPQGCRNGQCVGATCTGVMCTTPPAPRCMGNTAVVATSPGMCTDGTCKYPETNMACTNGCANGACVPATGTFTQVLPRVRHAITAVDQEPGSAGDDVIVVGPMGQASRWNGMQWSALPTGMNGNLSAVWFNAANSAFIVAETGLLKLGPAGVMPVTTLPPMTGNSRLVDVHGIGADAGNMAVVDNLGTVYRFRNNTWTTSSGNDGASRDKPPYRMLGVYMEPVAVSTVGARLRYWGQCGTPAGGCIVYQSSNGSYFDDRDSATANVRSSGPSLEVGGEGWAGLDVPQVRRHSAVTGMFDSLNVPTGLDGGPVVAIVPSASGTRAIFVLTAPDKVVGHLYRASGLAAAPTVEPLIQALYGFQAMSKTESSGVIVVDMNTTSNTSTISRRGATANEVLDLGAEDWLAGAETPGGSVLMNPYGDVAIRSNTSPTFQLRRITFDIQATDLAAGTTYVVLTAGDGSAWRLPYTGGTFTEVMFAQKASGLNAVCRASDSEWYLAGEGGALFAYDGTSTRAMGSNTMTELKDIDCPAAGLAVACGTGTVLRLVGGNWVAVPGAPASAITGCKLIGGAIYVAGPNLYSRFHNGMWTAMAARPALDGLVVKSVNEAYAAEVRTLLRFDGTAWQMVTMAPQALLTGFLIGQRVVLAGSGGVVMEGQ